MRTVMCMLALAIMVRAVAGQATNRSAGAPPPAIAECRPPHDGQAGDSAAALCLTRQEAIGRAMRANPGLQVAAALVAQARARKVQGTAIPDPVVEASVDQSRNLLGSGGQAAGRSLTTTLTIPFPARLVWEGRIGTAGIHETQFDSVLTAQQVASATSRQYDAVLAALRRQQDLNEARRLAQEFLEKTEARFAAGTVARLDVVRAQVEVARAENDLIAAEGEVTIARGSLNRLLGRAPTAPLATADTLAVPPDLPALENLEQWAIANRPEVGALASQEEAARAGVSLARASWLPDFTIGAGKDWADPGPGILTAGISLPIPLFYWQHARGEVAEARQHLGELAATRRDLEAAIREEVRTLWSSASVARRQALWLRDAVLPVAAEANRIATVSYGLGGSSALEVLEARQGLLEAEREYTEALATANSARADLERAVSRSLSTFSDRSGS